MQIRSSIVLCLILIFQSVIAQQKDSSLLWYRPNTKDFLNYTESISTTGKIDRQYSFTYISGKCYFGDGVDSIVKNLEIQFCSRPVDYEGDDLSTEDWDYSAIKVEVDSNGMYTAALRILESGGHYLLINSKPYALQWINESDVSVCPEPVNLHIDDTLTHDIHLRQGNQMTFEYIGDIRDRYINIEMYNLDELLVLEKGYTANDSSNIVTISGIPNGKYFFLMRVYFDPWNDSTKYEKFILPEKDMNFQEKIFTFKGGDSDTISFNSYKEENKTDEYSWYKVSNVDASEKIAAVVFKLDEQQVSYSSSSNGPIKKKITQNKRGIIGKFKNEIFPSDPEFAEYPGITWYPGTHCKEFAQIFNSENNDTTEVIIPNNPFGRIVGNLSLDSNQTFTIIVEDTKGNIIASDPSIFKNGEFYLYADTGVYNIRIIPTTEENNIGNWYPTSFIENIAVKEGSITIIPKLSLEKAKYSIEGQISTSEDPVIVCFDEFGEIVSLNTISLYKYFKSYLGDKCFFFDYRQILPFPYTVNFSINSIQKPGDYYLAYIERTGTNYDSVMVNWYGGEGRYQTIRWIEDVVSLSVPNFAKKINISEGNYITSISEWDENPIVKNGSIKLSGVTMFMHNKKLIIQKKNESYFIEIKIINLLGQEIYKTNFSSHERKIKIDLNNFSNGIYFCRLKNGESVSTKKLVVK